MLGHQPMGASALGESTTTGAAPPVGAVTSQPAPNGQSQRFVGTSSNATSGTVSLTSLSGGANVGPTSFAITANTFDFTISAIPAGSYMPTLTVTGPGGATQVTGTSSFSILGVDGGGVVVTDITPPTLAGVLDVLNVTSTGFTLSGPTATDNVGVVGYEFSTDGGVTWITSATPTLNISNATQATTYQLAMRAMDAAGNRSTSLTNAITTPADSSSGNGGGGNGGGSGNGNGGGSGGTITKPGAPTGIVATAAPGGISLSFQPPVSNGGTPILWYQVDTSTGESFEVDASPVLIVMQSSVPVSFSVTAVNAIGTGPASIPSSGVVPGDMESIVMSEAPRERTIRM